MRARRILAVLAALSATAVVAASCSPSQTDMQLHITGNVDCKASPTVHIRVGTPENIETQPAKVVSKLCEPGGELGTLTLTPPDGNKTATIAIAVVMAVGRDPATCVVGDSDGCSLQRRVIPFLEGEQLDLPIHFLLSCVKNLCFPGSTCADGPNVTDCVNDFVDPSTCLAGPCFPKGFPDNAKVTTTPDGSTQIGDDAQTDANGDGTTSGDSSNDATSDANDSGPQPNDAGDDALTMVEAGKDGAVIELDGGVIDGK